MASANEPNGDARPATDDDPAPRRRAEAADLADEALVPGRTPSVNPGRPGIPRLGTAPRTYAPLVGWEQLRAGIDLPFDPAVDRPAADRGRARRGRTPHRSTTSRPRRTTRSSRRLGGDVTPGLTVAVGAGSRGLTGRVELLRGTISGLRELGAEPFVVPAMGSHGGATADGQLAMLAELGMTEDALDAEIRSTMDTEVVARTADGQAPVPRHPCRRPPTASCPVNRIKPHTAFQGPIESGCTKMAVVGFGKQAGRGGVPRRHRRRRCATTCSAGIAALRATGRLLGGVASVEAAVRRRRHGARPAGRRRRRRRPSGR